MFVYTYITYAYKMQFAQYSRNSGASKCARANIAQASRKSRAPSQVYNWLNSI